MKEIQEHVLTTIKVCEFCGFKHVDGWRVKQCEEKHKQENCKHENLDYSWDDPRGHIEVRCNNCNLVVDRTNVFELKNSEGVKKIYDLIKTDSQIS